MTFAFMAQTVKNLLAMCETRVESLGREESLEKGMTTHSSIPAWIILGAWRVIVHGVTESQTQLNASAPRSEA